MEPPQHVRLTLPDPGKPWKNPGVALYEHWESVLHNFIGKWTTGGSDLSIMYGVTPGYGIGFVNMGPRGGSAPSKQPPAGGGHYQPNIAFGHVGTSGKNVRRHGANMTFVVRADGSFLLGHVHGQQQRDIVSLNTFLGWTHFHGQYHWMPYFTGNGFIGNYYSGPREESFLERPYVTEKVIQAHSWSDHGWWSRLEDPTGRGEFILRHAEDFPTSTLKGAPRYAKWDATRERRLVAARNRELVHRGLLTPGQHAQRLSEEDREKRIEADTERMAKLMLIH